MDSSFEKIAFIYIFSSSVFRYRTKKIIMLFSPCSSVTKVEII